MPEPWCIRVRAYLPVMMYRFPWLRRFVHRHLRLVHYARYLLLPRMERDTFIAVADRIAASRLFSRIEKVPRAGTLRDGVLTLHTGLKALPTAYHGYQFQIRAQRTGGIDDLEEETAFSRVLVCIGRGGVMVELGSFWAHYSLWFTSRVEGSVSYCIEPELRNLLYGVTNAELNGRRSSLVFLHNLIGARTDTTTDPPTLTIDQLVSFQGLPQIDILHADIQGAEAEMIEGASQTLASRLPRFVFISTHSDDLHRKCRAALDGHGYASPVSIPPFGEYHPDGLIVAAHAARDQALLAEVEAELRAR